MTEPNGGPAFPRPMTPGGSTMTPGVGGSSWSAQMGHPGMTLRDWFAGQALAVFIQNTTLNPLNADLYAAKAYEIADAMLAERAK